MLRTRNLSLKNTGRLLLSGLDWEVSAGQCWCVIGPNGAGKTTLLRTLAGLRSADEGTIFWKDCPFAEWSLRDLAHVRSYLPQRHSDAFGFTVIQTVLASRHPHETNGAWETPLDHQLAKAALMAMRVDHLAARDIRTLSGGERQRIAIAALLAQDTSVLLLDEPANALDLSHQVGVTHLIQQLCRRDSKAVVLVSHDLNLACSVATHVLLIMGDGRWQAGSAASILHAPLLSDCLGHQIDEIRHEGRTIFVPQVAL